MDPSIHLPKREDDDRSAVAPITATSYSSPTHYNPSGDPAGVGYTIMACGERTGKTSFLRLLLDTSDISPMASKEQLASVAKFVQGSSGHTSHIRTASINIIVDIEGNGAQRPLALTVIDTPSLHLDDEALSERVVAEMLRHVDARFAEGIDDDWKAQTGDHHVHLCLYFLDPDHIIPPSVPGPPAPPVSRTRGNSFSQPEPEPVILEPPVTTNPLLCRPTLPMAEINTIRRLSARVNVLPVIARADTLSNERLAAIKAAVRENLADAGIGFGIFDYQHLKEETLSNGDPSTGYSSHRSGSLNSPLPYALISPDMYSHSDGVTRIPLSRHELVHQYTPSMHHAPTSKFVRGKFIRSYRWGSLDVLDPNHSDFLPLRTSIFHHMETLQKYTREYLFEKFRADYHLQHPASRRSLPHHIAQVPGGRHHALSHASRPILAIDTAPHVHPNGHLQLSMSRNVTHGGDISSLSRAGPDSALKVTSASGLRSSKQRTKKITVACNFCRSRKLKCDGGRPACSQCLKRSNNCDYMTQNKRRNTLRQPQGEESGSGSEEDGEHDETSLSPEVSSQPLPRQSSNIDKIKTDIFPLTLSSSAASTERHDDSPSQPSSSRSKPSASSGETRSFFMDNELPHIATLSLPDPSPATPMSAPSLPPIRPASDLQAAQRKRAATVPGKSTRQSSASGPKVVACNHCRARKTKCDGAQPACSSCARKLLPCNYVHARAGSNGPSQKKPSRRSKPLDTSSHSPPSTSRVQPSNSVSVDGYPHLHNIDERQGDLKRGFDDLEANRPPKKMRIEESPMVAGIP